MTKDLSNSHPLNDKWDFWYHLSDDSNWEVDSYKKITTFDSVESTLLVYENIHEDIVKNTMLFVMREGIKPMWEDDKNKNGGCFSYKINNRIVFPIWKKLSYLLMGETILNNDNINNINNNENINGISISPKKNFCIVKIWFSNCDYTEPNIINNNIEGLSPEGCFFKKHIE